MPKPILISADYKGNIFAGDEQITDPELYRAAKQILIALKAFPGKKEG